ncbi:cytochrome c oxidase assembly protein [Polymorphobacter fuscus]|uniref:Cytochrome c oxidase assembly protein CtaG n=1 Tax=Sandarakinorhabdus fusca TaxID=1439888 RepID=A0A7C9KHD1_9SPHN|nr:cytochrome c oxidase assembly protein [Polymorphobacter fuscus]KAB7647500.1 cytochrome c oxidase assembly protein [Polymorphobacter fuscus]MQT16760.1 cytochrome c oxidase assembly protein [Polymorphobacter fuscus]NJC09252.1 cytochrome c oxidase assembly protein subunit 11 [Polymorphobacter fuscus]
MSDLALARAKRRTGLLAALMAVAMIGLAYASVPLYRLFCQATGFGGTTGRAEATAVPGADQLRALGGRTIKIRFDSNTAPGMAWRFAPRDRDTEIKIGEKRLAYFSATNLAAGPTTGRAIFNVSPDVAGAYFRKIECFCFTEQTLAAGETAQMPVTYFIDPAILDDPDAKKIDEITLSYTFFPVDNPEAKPVSATASTVPGNKG